MNTLQYLRQEQRRLWDEGDALMDQQDQIRRETKSQEIREGATPLWHDGLGMLRQSNALSPLIRMYEAHNHAYWFLIDMKYDLRGLVK